MTHSPGTTHAVLLVEDNDTIRGAFAILLEEHGYTVHQSRTGAEALLVATERLPDLILMDLGLPDISGLEVTRRLKAAEATSAIPIVALTGRALDADREACHAAGCSGYFAKPIDTALLLDSLVRFLGEPQQPR
jgi:two-component system, cell cycle response regulator DivK